MLAKLLNRIFTAFGDCVIRRAKRTPYFHLFHEDGRPYMRRYWLLRIGMPSDWSQLEARADKLERYLAMPNVSDVARQRMQGELGEIRGQLYPRFGIRIHHIISSDEHVFHDHPWNFITWILRGGYTEITPILPDGSVVRRRHHDAGSLRFVRAEQWHYVLFDQDRDAWTMFFTFRKRQQWGFLVNGIKVPWRQYLDMRRAELARKAVRA